MKTPEDLTNCIFKKITVLSMSENKDKQGKILWNCVCECGTKMLVRPYSLKRGLESCGCAQNIRSRKLNVGLNQKFSSYKRDARVRNLEFKLSFEEFSKLLTGNCSYCGQEPKEWNPYLKENGKYSSTGEKLNKEYVKRLTIKKNGIDRKDNSIGYTNNNCASCCETCNMMKKSLGDQEFLEHINKIYNHSIDNNSLIQLK